MEGIKYFQALFSGLFKPTTEIELPFECDLALVQKILAAYPEAIGEDLGPQELQALDYFGIKEDYLRAALQEGSPINRAQRERLIEMIYPLKNYLSWSPKIDLDSHRLMINGGYLPNPLDRLVELPEARPRIEQWLKDHLGFDVQGLNQICEATRTEWSIAGGFLTWSLTESPSYQFGDIDFWVQGREQSTLTRALIYQLTKVGLGGDTWQEYGNGHNHRGNRIFTVRDLLTGEDLIISINPIDHPTVEELLRYFDLDACKFALDRFGLWGTVRSLECLRTQICQLPYYFQARAEGEPEWSLLEVTRRHRYLANRSRPLKKRVQKYEAKGFEFTQATIDPFQEALITDLLERYLPMDSQITHPYFRMAGEVDKLTDQEKGWLSVEIAHYETILRDHPVIVDLLNQLL